MELQTLKLIFYIFLHYVIIALLLRSIFFLIKAKSKIKQIDFWLLIIPIISGVGYLSYGAFDFTEIANRFPWMMIFIAGAANAFFMLSKSKKEQAFSIQNYLIDYYSDYNTKTLEMLGYETGHIKNISFKRLKAFEINKLFIIDKKRKKEGIIRFKVPFKNTIMFSAFLKKDGIFGLQTHNDADEHLYIVSGEAIELHTQKIYKTGDFVFIPAGKIHGFKGLTEITKFRSYLIKIDDLNTSQEKEQQKENVVQLEQKL